MEHERRPTALRSRLAVLLAILAATVFGLAVWLPRCEPGPEDLASREETERDVPVLDPGRVDSVFAIEPSEPDTAPPEVAIRARTGLEIHGRVFACDGVTPAEGVRIEVSRWPKESGVEWSPAGRSTKTGPDGRFVFRNLPDRRISMRCEGKKGRGGPRSATAAAGARGVRIVLSPRTDVRFLLVDAATGRSLVSERVEVLEIRDGEERGWASSSSRPPPQGQPAPEARPWPTRFIWPGKVLRYRVRAIGYRPSEVIEVNGDVGGLVRTIRVELVPDAASVARVILDCRDEAGRPVTRFNVTVFKDGGWNGQGVRAPGGRHEVDVIPGPVILIVGSFPTGTASDLPWLPERLELRIEKGETVTRAVTLRPGGFIRVRGHGRLVKKPDRVLCDGRDHGRGFSLSGDDEGHIWTAGPFAPGVYDVERDLDEDRVERVSVEVRAREITTIRMGPRTRPAEDR